MAYAAGEPASAPAVVAILGPTASGKSALGLALAEALGGEILCCDSMQVYRGMDIGTAKATAAERAGIPHHLLDLVDPDEQFHAAVWAEAARVAIAEVSCTRAAAHHRGRHRALLPGARPRAVRGAPARSRDPRAPCQSRRRSMASRHCTHVWPQSIRRRRRRSCPGDLVRTSRALEVYEQTGVTITALRGKQTAPPVLRLFSVLLDLDLELLRPRIASRVEAMMSAGFLDEVRALRDAGHRDSRAMQALGYKQLGHHLDGVLSLDAAVAEIKVATVAYARRQRTWFRREEVDLRTYRPLPPAPLANLIHGWAQVHGRSCTAWAGSG